MRPLPNDLPHPPPSTRTITATTPPTTPPAPIVENRRSSPAFSARHPSSAREAGPQNPQVEAFGFSRSHLAPSVLELCSHLTMFKLRSFGPSHPTDSRSPERLASRQSCSAPDGASRSPLPSPLATLPSRLKKVYPRSAQVWIQCLLRRTSPYRKRPITRSWTSGIRARRSTRLLQGWWRR